MKSKIFFFLFLIINFLYASDFIALSPGYENDVEIIFNNNPVFIFEGNENSYIRVYCLDNEIFMDKTHIYSLNPIYEQKIDNQYFFMLSDYMIFEKGKIYAWCLVDKNLDNTMNISNILYFKINSKQNIEINYELNEILKYCLNEYKVFNQLILDGFYPTGNIKINGIIVNNRQFYEFIHKKTIKGIYIE